MNISPLLPIRVGQQYINALSDDSTVTGAELQSIISNVVNSMIGAVIFYTFTKIVYDAIGLKQ